MVFIEPGLEVRCARWRMVTKLTLEYDGVGLRGLGTPVAGLRTVQEEVEHFHDPVAAAATAARAGPLESSRRKGS